MAACGMSEVLKSYQRQLLHCCRLSEWTGPVLCSVRLSQHDGGQIYNWGDPALKMQNGTHPVAFAANGSHGELLRVLCPQLFFISGHTVQHHQSQDRKHLSAMHLNYHLEDVGMI